jgi:amino acid permease
MIPSESLFNRAEVLGGLTARRARTLLYLIESRSARLAAQARRAMTPFRSEQVAAEDELAFITAFTEGRDPPLKPSIQDLEHFAAQWADLVPREPRMQAAVAHALGAKYRFTHEAVPGIRSALGLDESAVQDAFLRQYGTPLVSIYQGTPDLPERLRWAWARLATRLESLPPFWTSFALTLTETVGAGILALPIALAGIGPLPGILLMIVLGLVNVVTIIGAAEAAARSGTVRYGSGFMGRMVGDYLGNPASLVLIVAVALLCFLTLPVLYIGFGSAMAGFTGLPEPVWVIGLFLACLYLLRRESLDATVGSALVVGAVNIVIILLLSLLAFARLDPTNLLYYNVPYVNGQPFEPSLWGLIFGVILLAFFGHMSVNNCAQVVLRRDASARSLVGGAAAAQVVVIALYSIWCLAVAGAVPPATLQAETGTVLAPLASSVGPIAVLLSSIFVILALAIGSLHSSLGLFNLVRERLPAQASLSVRLPLRDGRLILTPRRSIRDLFRAGPQSSRLSVTYLGLDDIPSRNKPCPRLRLDLTLGEQVHVLETTLKGALWDQAALDGLLPDLHRRGMPLSLEVVEAAPAYIHLRVASSLAIRYEGQRESAGFDLAALLEMADGEQHLWTWLSRQAQPVGLAEMAAGARVDEDTAQALVKSLIQRRLVTEDLTGGQLGYRARFAPRRGHSLPEALRSEEAPQRLDERKRPGAEEALTPPTRWASLNAGGRYGLCALPTVAAFLLTEYLIVSGRASFAGAFSLIGVLLASLLGGFFPVLLLVASRRKGDVVPGVAPRLIGRPLILTVIYLLYLAGLLMHGLIIWQGPVQRVAALGVAVLAIAMPIVMVRGGAFRRRAVIELYAHLDGKRPATFAVSAAGQPRPAEVKLHYDHTSECSRAANGEISDFAALRSVSFRSLPGSEGGAADLPPGVRDVKVWTHALAPDGDDHALPAAGEIRSGDVVTACDLAALGGQVVLPLAGADLVVQVAFQGPSPSGTVPRRDAQ